MNRDHSWVFFVLTLLGVFLFGKNDFLSAQVVINEIGAYGATNEEWIELFNTGTDPADLTGWKFWEANTNHGLTITTNGSFILLPNAYAVIVQQEEGFRRTHPTFSGTIFDSSWGSLNESGEMIGIKNNSGAFVEQFTYIPVQNHSLERKNASLADYSETNWHEHSTGDTAGEANSELQTDGDSLEEPREGNEPTQTDSTPPDDTHALQQIRLSEFLSYPNTGETEWIEIENTGDTPVDLHDVRLRDGVSILVTGTTTLPAHTLFVFTISGSRLNNGGDTIILETLHGTVLDRVSYGNFDDGTIADNAPSPAQNSSLSFINEVWEETRPTRGTVNITTTPITPSTQNQSVTQQQSQTTAPFQPSANIRSGDIIISEFVSDPTDGEGEFVELQNRSNQTIDISGWYIEEGSRAKTTLTGAIRSMEFFVIEKPKGGLNNAGDVIVLFTKDQKEIDRVAYGTWNDGNTADNATAPTDPTGAARVDGRDTGFDKDDWRETTFITKGGVNRFSKETDTQTSQIGEYVDGLIINELYPNPPGSDEEEFIELYHNGKTHVRLAGWSLRDESLRIYPLEDIVLYPNTYLLLSKKVTGISLNNTNDVVELLSPEKKVVSRVPYDHVPEGESYNRTQTGMWVWSTEITSGKVNNIKEKNRPPIANIETNNEAIVGVVHTFDASDSSDPEHDTLFFEWTFSRGKKLTGATVSYVFSATGTTTVSLIVKDTKENSTKTTVDIFVRPKMEDSQEPLAEKEIGANDSTEVQISELTPNPVGSDETEFIELHSTGLDQVDISGWQLSDAGGKTYTIPEQTVIDGGDYIIILRSKSGIALNNTTDTITLKNKKSVTIDVVTYKDSKEGFAYARKNATVWAWTKTVTPGQENVVTLPVVTAATNATKKIVFQEIEELPKGKLVTVAGQVIVLPNTWSTQMLTILEKETGQTVPIFLSNKQFPILMLGDEVRVTGSTSEASGVKRVNAKRTSDIVITGHSEITANAIASLESIGEKNNLFVTVTGTVTDVSSKGFSIENNDELFIKFRGTLLKHAPKVSIGDMVKITGVVFFGEDITLTPRDATDIIVLTTKAVTTNKNQTNEVAKHFKGKEAATGAGVGATLLAALGRARLILFIKGAKRIAGSALSKFLPPRV